MSALRLAIIGAGHLGRIHARLAARLPETEIAGVVDTCPAAAETLARELQLPAFSDLSRIERGIDAAIVCTPTHSHFQIARRLLRCGVHVLVEKPFTATAPQADQLLELAERSRRVVQVGHVERFNPAFEAAATAMPRARYIEARRCSAYTFRSTDIGVVHDLMIHDIDLACALTDSPLREVRATGLAVFGPHEDLAEARLQFEDGTVANLSASRCSPVPARQFAWISERGRVELDLAHGTVHCVTPSPLINRDRRRDIAHLDEAARTRIRESLFAEVLPHREIPAEPRNAIQQEQIEFLQAIRGERVPRCDGRAGRRAVAIAQDIVACIARHEWWSGDQVRIGPQTEPGSFPLRVQDLVSPRRAA